MTQDITQGRANFGYRRRFPRASSSSVITRFLVLQALSLKNTDFRALKKKRRVPIRCRREPRFWVLETIVFCTLPNAFITKLGNYLLSSHQLKTGLTKFFYMRRAISVLEKRKHFWEKENEVIEFYTEDEIQFESVDFTFLVPVCMTLDPKALSTLGH